jgi:hypothetical protein
MIRHARGPVQKLLRPPGDWARLAGISIRAGAAPEERFAVIYFQAVGNFPDFR